MKRIIKELPLPITGLILGLAAAGNLFLSYGEIYRNVLGLLSGIFLVMVLLKILIYPKEVKKELENVVVASVFPTLSMAIMLLATYLKPVSGSMAYMIWLLGLTLHILLMINFTIKHVLDFNIKKVFPSWFIVYVGIVVGSITGPAFGRLRLAQILFYFGSISFLVLLPLVLKRVLIIKGIPEPALATKAILTAPAALCLAGYMNSFPEKNMLIVYGLLTLSQVLYFFVLTQLPKLLSLPFMPSYSAFTFPLVITGISIKLTNGFLLNTNREIGFIRILLNLEETIAILLLLYVLYSYISFLLAKTQRKEEVKTA